MMTASAAHGEILAHFDDATRLLVRVAAVVAAGDEADVRAELQRASAAGVKQAWVEELLLQTYLFAGFPRALNAMREWRRLVSAPQPNGDEKSDGPRTREAGEATCAKVYGEMYDRLRENIRALHPLLDEWMIVEGYGKVLSRSALDLGRRELCIVAACAATGQDRQLQSHLHGALNVGVDASVITAMLVALRGVVREALLARATRLWSRINPTEP